MPNASAGNELAQDDVVLTASRVALAVMLVGCIAFVAGAVAMVVSGIPWAWFVIAYFGFVALEYARFLQEPPRLALRRATLSLTIPGVRPSSVAARLTRFYLPAGPFDEVEWRECGAFRTRPLWLGGGVVADDARYRIPSWFGLAAPDMARMLNERRAAAPKPGRES